MTTSCHIYTHTHTAKNFDFEYSTNSLALLNYHFFFMENYTNYGSPPPTLKKNGFYLLNSTNFTPGIFNNLLDEIISLKMLETYHIYEVCVNLRLNKKKKN